LKIDIVKVTSDDRIPAVVQNKIDIECGSTTAQCRARQAGGVLAADVVAGTKLMVPKTSTISAPKDLQGKTVVVTKGTTTSRRCMPSDRKVCAWPEHHRVA